MIYFILDKDTDDLIDVLTDPSQDEIEKFELENPDKYLADEENYFVDSEFNEDDIDDEDIW